MWRWIGTYFYITISALVKVVIGLFLLRICSHQRWQRITLWALMGIVTVYNLFYIFIAIFACRPVEYQWTGYDPATPKGECNSSSFVTIPTYMSAFLNVLADWMLPLLPASLVWKTKMETRKKVSVCAVMALGSMCVPFADSTPKLTTDAFPVPLSPPSSASPTPTASSTTPSTFTPSSPSPPGRRSKSASDSPPPRWRP